MAWISAISPTATIIKVMNCGLAKKFVDLYDPEALIKQYRLDPEQICEDIMKNLKSD